MTKSTYLSVHIRYPYPRDSREDIRVSSCRPIPVSEMTMFRKTISITSAREGDIIDITPQVQEALSESGIRSGLVHLFVRHSTAALTVMEYEPGVIADFRRALSVCAPDTIAYAHNTRWGDGNGRSHVRAALIGPDLTIPAEAGKLLCGTWQQIVLAELDVNAGRTRTVICTITGE